MNVIDRLKLNARNKTVKELANALKFISPELLKTLNLTVAEDEEILQEALDLMKDIQSTTVRKYYNRTS